MPYSCGQAAPRALQLLVCGMAATLGSPRARAEGCVVLTAPPLSVEACEAAVERQLVTHISAAERRNTGRALCRDSHDLGLDPLLVLALIDAESTADPRALSSRGAQGLMQLMPGTATSLAEREHIVVPAAGMFDPTVNVQVGMRYLAALRREFGRLDYALLAYNLGASRLRARLRRPVPAVDACTNALVAHVLRSYSALHRRYAPNASAP